MISSTKPSRPIIALVCGSFGAASASLRVMDWQTCSRERAGILSPRDLGGNRRGTAGASRLRNAPFTRVRRERQGPMPAPRVRHLFIESDGTVVGMDGFVLGMKTASEGRVAGAPPVVRRVAGATGTGGFGFGRGRVSPASGSGCAGRSGATV